MSDKEEKQIIAVLSALSAFPNDPWCVLMASAYRNLWAAKTLRQSRVTHV